MPDRFSRSLDQVDDPPRRAWAVIPSDTTDLPDVATRVYVGGGGSLVLTLADMPDGTSVTLVAVPIGSYLDMRIKRIWATSGATNIVAFT